MVLLIRFTAIFLPLLLLGGCFFGSDRPAQQQQSEKQSAAGSPASPSTLALDRTQSSDRRIAETHSLQVETDAGQLQQRYDRDYAKCLELRCEIVRSAVKSGESASLYARLSPESLRIFLDFLGNGPGELKSHEVSAEDRTLEVVDTESKLVNLEALRNRLRTLLESGKADNVESILKIENELARLQGEIDALKGRKQFLDNITATAAVSLAYAVPFPLMDTNYAALRNSFQSAWEAFIENLAGVIEAVGFVTPWIVFFGFAGWLAAQVYKLMVKRKPVSPRPMEVNTGKN